MPSPPIIALAEVGQSNAGGHNVVASQLPSYLQNFDFGQTYIFNGDGPYWGVYQPGVNSGLPNQPQSFGPEVMTLYRLRLEHPDAIILLWKSTKGSTGVAYDTTQVDWHPNSTGEMFDTTTARIAAGKAFLGFDPGPITVIFRGGETDATDALKAAQHVENAEALVAAARLEWGADHFVFANINAPAVAFENAVRAAQTYVDLRDPLVHSFSTEGFGLQADGVHDNVDGILAVGQGFYDTITSWF